MADIVVADDDPDIRDVNVMGLRRAGHTVTACNDGAALLRTVRATEPDLVVTDNQMPVLTGLEVLTLLRQDPATTGIPVVLATGSVPPEDARHLLGGRDQLLIKPFTPRQLLAAVDNVLHHLSIG